MMIATILRENAQMKNVTANQAGNYKTALVIPFAASTYRVLNPNQAGLFSQSTGQRGGGNLPAGLFELLRPIFHPNQSKHGLK